MLKKGLLAIGLLTSAVNFSNDSTEIKGVMMPVTLGSITEGFTMSLAPVDIASSELLGHKSHTILIHSPGGALDTYYNIYDAVDKSNMEIVTKVDNYAASAAALLFLKGDKRVMKERATLIFHGVRIGTHNLTQYNLQQAVDFIDSGKLKKVIEGNYEPTTIEDLQALTTIEFASQFFKANLSAIEVQIKTNLEGLKKANNYIVKNVTRQLNATGKFQFTEEWVIVNLFDNFKGDVVIDSATALKLGIATEVEA